MNVLLVGQLSAHRQYFDCAPPVTNVYDSNTHLALWSVGPDTTIDNLKCFFESGTLVISFCVV